MRNIGPSPAAYLAAAGGRRTADSGAIARCQDPVGQAQPDRGPPPAAAPGDTAPPEPAPGQNPPAKATPEPSTPPPPKDEGAAGKEAPSPAPATTEEEAAPEHAVVSTSYRLRQLAANLERRRWLSRSPAARRVDVNTASCTLVYVKPDDDPWVTRVVCGKTGHETPSIQGLVPAAGRQPPWRVPMDIARKEIFSKGGGYLRRAHMHVVNGQVVQRPGPNNSLGVVKFDVQDPYAIYLHDTPSKSAFSLPERHRSHGCVRVQNAVGFARLIAGQSGKADAFNKALASGKPPRWRSMRRFRCGCSTTPRSPMIPVRSPTSPTHTDGTTSWRRRSVLVRHQRKAPATSPTPTSAPDLRPPSYLTSGSRPYLAARAFGDRP